MSLYRGTSSAGNTRGLIEARPGAESSAKPTASSAGNTRGLIEALGQVLVLQTPRRSSAGNTRGLIEAWERVRPTGPSTSRLPRGIPAASLKPSRLASPRR